MKLYSFSVRWYDSALNRDERNYLENARIVPEGSVQHDRWPFPQRQEGRQVLNDGSQQRSKTTPTHVEKPTLRTNNTNDGARRCMTYFLAISEESNHPVIRILPRRACRLSTLESEDRQETAPTRAPRTTTPNVNPNVHNVRNDQQGNLLVGTRGEKGRVCWWPNSLSATRELLLIIDDFFVVLDPTQPASPTKTQNQVSSAKSNRSCKDNSPLAAPHIGHLSVFCFRGNLFILR